MPKWYDYEQQYPRSLYPDRYDPENQRSVRPDGPDEDISPTQSDRRIAGESLTPDESLISKNGRFELRFDIGPVATGSGNSFGEVYIRVSDLQDNTDRYFLLAEQRNGFDAGRLKMNFEGWIEIFDNRGTLTWKSDNREGQETWNEFDREAFWRLRKTQGTDAQIWGRGHYKDFRLIMQDDGRVVAFAEYDWIQEFREGVGFEYKEEEHNIWRGGHDNTELHRLLDDLEMRRKRWKEGQSQEPDPQWLETYRQQRKPRDYWWEFSDKPHYSEAFYPGKNKMRVGDKLLRGGKLSLPSGRASFVLEPRGQLYLYGLNEKIKSISTPKWPDADPKGEYAILNDRGELVHYYEHEREHEQISIAKFGKEATWKEP